MSYSIYKSSDFSYLSSAINIAGSQRMRTMLIANYAQQLHYGCQEHTSTSELETITALLENEVSRYIDYAEALAHGDSSLKMKANPFVDIESDAHETLNSARIYALNASLLILNPDEVKYMNSIIHTALPLKNKFHDLTEAFQVTNDELILKQKRLNTWMIIIGVIITALGLSYTSKIKKQEYFSNRDFLTRLKNRNSFFEFALTHTCDAYAMFFIDLNKFKPINDTFGHDVGDQVLIVVGNILKKIFGDANVYRYGGDEFIAIIDFEKEKVNLEERNSIIHSYVNAFKAEILAPIEDKYGNRHNLGASLGIARGDVGFYDWHEFVTFTDQLMYEGKLISSNVVMCLTEEDFVSRANLLQGLIYNLDTSRVSSELLPCYRYMALEPSFYNSVVRWKDSNLNKNTSQLLMMLKKAGHVIELDKFMFLDAVSVHSEHVYDFHKPIMVNITEETLSTAQTNGFLNDLKSNKQYAKRIFLKIQFQFLYSEEAQRTISFAKDLGYLIAIDNLNFDYFLMNFHKCLQFNLYKIDFASLEAILKNEHLCGLFNEFLSILLENHIWVVLEGEKIEYSNGILEQIRKHPNVFYSRE